MNSQRGQASILIALIFQVLFVFFAMVINVGLVIHDKINLQNSVDIAAYYGAMKQAEVMTAMAHVNFQTRQAWKLLNWRLWALGDAGRNRYLAGTGSPGTPGETPAVWQFPVPPPPSGGYQGPIVCVQNNFWYESWVDPRTGVRRSPSNVQNACRSARANAPVLRPPRLNWAQQTMPWAQAWARQGRDIARQYGASCQTSGIINMIMATRILSSYKQAVLMRRRAMQNLEKLLVENNGQDFKDLGGQSVAGTVQKTFLNNLTLPNKTAVAEFEFNHSLNRSGQPVPFLVPIDVRLFVKYADLFPRGNDTTGVTCDMRVKNVDQQPEASARMDAVARDIFKLAQEMAGNDLNPALPLINAQAFLNEDLSDQGQKRSLVGFEKDPWTVAYVVVKAKTRPKMLFAPLLGSIELTAEAYAMPFGGKMGPWYGTQWQPGMPSSQGEKLDLLLPPRVGGTDPMTPETEWIPPRYSRFPGDTLGPRSELYRALGLSQMLPSPSTVDRLPRYASDDYFNITSDITSPNLDPIVSKNNPSQNDSFIIRKAELMAVAPDLFDAAYYSIQGKFTTQMMSRAGPAVQKACGEGDGPYCWDFGSFRRQGTPQLHEVAEQISLNENTSTGRETFWTLKKLEHVNTSWSQDSRTPDKFPEGVGIGKLEQANGRSGYSVKIVSRRFLTRGDLPLGGGNTSGAIKNNPAAIGLRE